MDAAKLTFKALNKRIDELPAHASVRFTISKREVRGYFIGFGAGFLGLAAGKLLPSNMTTVVITATLLAVELIALAIAMIPPRPWRIPGFVSERSAYADQLDHDMLHYEELLAWLRTFPKEQLEFMAGYVAERREFLQTKQPLLTGSIDKLGALPIVFAVFLQFSNLRWPLQITWPELIFALVLAWMYWTCLLTVSLQFRARLYELVLKRAIESPSTLA